MVKTERQLSILSQIGMRAAFGESIYEAKKSGAEDILIVTADTSSSGGLDRFRKVFPECSVEVGISEQNLVGVSSGIAASNPDCRVVVATFAPFLVERAFEQIEVCLGYNVAPVKLVGLASGLALADLGYTHCCFNDIALINTVPGVEILSPSDCTTLLTSIGRMLSNGVPTYLRLTGGAPVSQIYKEITDYPADGILWPELLDRDNVDLLFISTGSVVYEALQAARSLIHEGYTCNVADILNLSGNFSSLHSQILRAKQVIVVEEHLKEGGLYTILLSKFRGVLKECHSVSIHKDYVHYSNWREALCGNGLSAEQIYSAACNILGR